MTLDTKYCAYVGTATGALAYIHCNSDENLKYELKNVEKSEVTTFEWDKSECEIIIGHKNGVVKYYNTVTNQFTKRIDCLEGEGPIVGACQVDDDLVVGRQNGVINIWSESNLTTFSLNLQSGSSMDCCVQNKVNYKLVGTGGENNDFKLWDVESKSNVFKAKALPHDELNLPVQTTLSGICFFENEEHLAGCSAREGRVLLYDKRAQRRPVVKFFEENASFTTIASIYKERQCVVGTNKGYIQLLDLRAPAKVVKTYKSFVGGITSLTCDTFSSIVVGTSLDRYIRVHNINTKECIFKKYMKQCLTKVLIKPIVKVEAKTEDENIEVNDNAEVDEEYESLFQNMETVEDKKPKKRKISKTLSKIEVNPKKKSKKLKL